MGDERLDIYQHRHYLKLLKAPVALLTLLNPLADWLLILESLLRALPMLSSISLVEARVLRTANFLVLFNVLHTLPPCTDTLSGLF